MSMILSENRCPLFGIMLQWRGRPQGTAGRVIRSPPKPVVRNCTTANTRREHNRQGNKPECSVTGRTDIVPGSAKHKKPACRPRYIPVFRSMWCGRRSSPEFLSSTYVGAFSASAERRMPRFDGEVFRFGTAIDNSTGRSAVRSPRGPATSDGLRKFAVPIHARRSFGQHAGRFFRQRAAGAVPSYLTHPT